MANATSTDAQRRPSNDVTSLNSKIFGATRFYLAFIRFLRDWPSYRYLLETGRFRQLCNFFYTKALLPTGEGSQRWLYGVGLEWLVRKFPVPQPLPRFVEVETTTVCNKKCLICEYNYWPEGEQIKRHMSFEEFKHISDQFPVLRWINLTGEGSSFLNKDYFLMLKHLSRERKTSIWLVDHLADISFERLEKDVLPYVHGIYLSIDGATKKTYESIKVGCNFDSVIMNLKAILAYKRRNKTPFPHISFRYVILNNNLHEMPLLLDLLNSLAKPWEWGGSSSYVEFTGLLYFPEIESYYVEKIPEETIGELLKRRHGIHFMFSHPEEERNPPIERCTAWMEPYIMMPGYVIPCCSVLMSNRRPFLRKYSFGNVFEKSFEDIWNSPGFREFRKIIVDPSCPVPKICVGCRAFRTVDRAKSRGVWDMYEDGKP
ncbi:MAG TPA: SPASM domain-containing protein [Syntrophobacteria bacterium]|nr:SPASM domain-containing protein [Syntrophobacteria bacterium]